MPPEPGDIISFALSARAAEAQNTPPLTADHRPRKPDDTWCKLYAVHRELQVLFDRHGGAATATFMACESPPLNGPPQATAARARVAELIASQHDLVRRMVLAPDAATREALAALDGEISQVRAGVAPSP